MPSDNAKRLVRQMADRFDARQCTCCGADSGKEALLPAGWSFLVWGDSAEVSLRGKVCAFMCDTCTTELGLPEARNYGEELN